MRKENIIALSGDEKQTAYERGQHAFNYGKDFRRKPIVSCGVVTISGKDVIPSIHPMPI